MRTIQIINTPHVNSSNIQTISFTLFEVDKQNFIDTYLDNLNSLFIDRHGWFPSVMIMTNKNNLIRKIKYNREELFNNINKLKELTLIYEAKYDDYELYNGVLYHLTIQHYIPNIEEFGLIPKNSSKLTYYPSRIYVCKDINDCKKLISRIKFLLLNDSIDKPKSNKQINWCIFKINLNNEIKLYKDPNYNVGYFILDNIHPNNLELIEKENV